MPLGMSHEHGTALRGRDSGESQIELMGSCGLMTTLCSSANKLLPVKYKDVRWGVPEAGGAVLK